MFYLLWELLAKPSRRLYVTHYETNKMTLITIPLGAGAVLGAVVRYRGVRFWVRVRVRSKKHNRVRVWVRVR